MIGVRRTGPRRRTGRYKVRTLESLVDGRNGPPRDGKPKHTEFILSESPETFRNKPLDAPVWPQRRLDPSR